MQFAGVEHMISAMLTFRNMSIRHERVQPVCEVALLVRTLLVAGAVLLAIVCNLMWVRGMEGGFKWRLKLGLERLTTPPAPASRSRPAVCGNRRLHFLQADIVNRFVTTKAGQRAQARYEKQYKQYSRSA